MNICMYLHLHVSINNKRLPISIMHILSLSFSSSPSPLGFPFSFHFTFALPRGWIACSCLSSCREQEWCGDWVKWVFVWMEIVVVGGGSNWPRNTQSTGDQVVELWQWTGLLLDLVLYSAATLPWRLSLEEHKARYGADKVETLLCTYEARTMYFVEDS